MSREQQARPTTRPGLPEYVTAAQTTHEPRGPPKRAFLKSGLLCEVSTDQGPSILCPDPKGLPKQGVGLPLHRALAELVSFWSNGRRLLEVA